MDFVEISKSEVRGNNRKSDFVIHPDFLYANIKDLVTRGSSFYAFWADDHWSTSLDELILRIDKEVIERSKKEQQLQPEAKISTRLMNQDGSGMMKKFKDYTSRFPSKDTVKFNSNILFADVIPKREDYATTQLSYTPKRQATPYFDEMMSTLYDKENLDKILWFMGAVLTNSMKDIQKFMYLYGGKGTGKGTVIDIFRALFEGYYGEIDLATLTGGGAFATSQVQELPLLVDSDSDLSKIKQDQYLLKLTAHEPLPIHKKYQTEYELEFDGLLITASNQRYQVRNVDSGIVRRAVVIEPTNNRISYRKYMKAKQQIKFELAGIAYKAIKHFQKEGPSRYENVTDVEMMEATDHIFAFVREYSESLGDPCTLSKAAELYKVYLEDIGFETRGYKRKIANELQRYYKEYLPKFRIDDRVCSNVFKGFKRKLVFPDEKLLQTPKLSLNGKESNFDLQFQNKKAQYATANETPKLPWAKVETKLKDLDTSKLHYVKVPNTHIVVDFDLRNADGDKDLNLNLERAAQFPETYAEVSKSGQGVHLHYNYKGKVDELSSIFEEHIEVKVFKGGSSLRRKLTKFNDKPIADLEEGFLPLKKEDAKMYDDVKTMIWNEKKMRTAVQKNLRKEYHSATKPSMDFIAHIFEEAEKTGVNYDLSDLKNDILIFALKSTHQKDKCLSIANSIKYKSDTEETSAPLLSQQFYPDEDLVFFDIEVFSNLLLVCWKRMNDEEMTVWFNPSSVQIEELFKKPLVGFNNRRYDNHILYGRMLGKSTEELFEQSQQIINGGTRSRGMYSGAYRIAYADIYEYSSIKQSLKKWEIKMGIMHDESEFPWDQPLDKENWHREAEYCTHDVEATIKLFKYIYADYKARKILCELTDLPVNATTQEQAAKFMFGNDPNPNEKFVYTDLSKQFPGYKYEAGVSTYRGETVGEGGYVYSEPGIYENVVEDDAESMHPSSIIALNYFGPYTSRFAELKNARIDVKHHDFDKCADILGGVLVPYLNDNDYMDLAHAMKIIINIIYGFTSAKFQNKFTIKENKDNIVAKRGALFMIDLKHAVQEKGWRVVHIKTDSIKLDNVTDEKIKFVKDFGEKYGYNFAVEHVFDKMALLNRAVLIGHVEDNPAWGKEQNTWTPIGKEFAEPYVFKQLFSHEQIEDEDFAQTKSSQTPMYIDDRFIGKVAQVYASLTGGDLVKASKDGEKMNSVQGTKGYKWSLFSEYKGKDDVCLDYYDKMVETAIKDLDSVGEAWKFLDDLPKQYEGALLPF